MEPALPFAGSSKPQRFTATAPFDSLRPAKPLVLQRKFFRKLRLTSRCQHLGFSLSLSVTHSKHLPLRYRLLHAIGSAKTSDRNRNDRGNSLEANPLFANGSRRMQPSRRCAGEPDCSDQGDPEGFLNKGYVCPKGLASADRLTHPGRLLHPMKRKGSEARVWENITWSEANTVCCRPTE